MGRDRVLACLGAVATAALAYGLAGGAAWAVVVLAPLAAAGVLVAWYAVARAARTSPPAEELTRRDATGLGGWLAVVERAMDARDRGGYDQQLRPDLTRLASALLAGRYDVDLHHDPAAARELLGTDVWPLVDPRRAGERPTARPVGGERLGAVLTRLERLSGEARDSARNVGRGR
jgi:hypothetical protein